MYHWKFISKTFPMVYYKTKKTNMQSFSDCIAGWLKEPQWENDGGSYSHSFILVQWSEKHSTCWQLIRVYYNDYPN
jgi:hypothetical protein